MTDTRVETPPNPFWLLQLDPFHPWDEDRAAAALQQRRAVWQRLAHAGDLVGELARQRLEQQGSLGRALSDFQVREAMAAEARAHWSEWQRAQQQCAARMTAASERGFLLDSEVADLLETYGPLLGRLEVYELIERALARRAAAAQGDGEGLLVSEAELRAFNGQLASLPRHPEREPDGRTVPAQDILAADVYRAPAPRPPRGPLRAAGGKQQDGGSRPAALDATHLWAAGGGLLLGLLLMFAFTHLKPSSSSGHPAGTTTPTSRPARVAGVPLSTYRAPGIHQAIAGFLRTIQHTVNGLPTGPHCTVYPAGGAADLTVRCPLRRQGQSFGTLTLRVRYRSTGWQITPHFTVP